MNDNKSAYNSNIYDSHIENVLPYYSEYHRQIMDMVGTMFGENVKWLDTGCGTGTLAKRVLDERDDVEFTLADPSEQMMGVAKQKLSGRDIQYINLPSQKLEFDSVFDVVTAVQSHHYLQPDERREAVQKCYSALREGGLFITFENIRMSTDESEAIALSRWAKFLAEHDNTEEDIQGQMDRRGTEVFPITIEEHLQVLKDAGFKSVNLLWASYLQAGFWAVK